MLCTWPARPWSRSRCHVRHVAQQSDTAGRATSPRRWQSQLHLGHSCLSDNAPMREPEAGRQQTAGILLLQGGGRRPPWVAVSKIPPDHPCSRRLA